jgi:hypothetical protein
MPPKRPPRRPRIAGRLIAGAAGLSLAIAGMVGTLRAFMAGASRFGSFGPLALLVPAYLLLTYAVTGRIRRPQ